MEICSWNFKIGCKFTRRCIFAIWMILSGLHCSGSQIYEAVKFGIEIIGTYKQAKGGSINSIS